MARKSGRTKSSRTRRYAQGRPHRRCCTPGASTYCFDNDEQSYLLALDKLTGKKSGACRAKRRITPFVWQNDKRTEIVTAGSGAIRSSPSRRQSALVAQRHVEHHDRDALRRRRAVVRHLRLRRRQDANPSMRSSPARAATLRFHADTTSSANSSRGRANHRSLQSQHAGHDGRLFILYDRGQGELLQRQNRRASLRAPDTARRQKRSRLRRGPWATRFCLSENGVCFVLRSGDKFEQLHTNALAEDDMCMATPALVKPDRLLIRTSAWLYCFRKTP